MTNTVVRKQWVINVAGEADDVTAFIANVDAYMDQMFEALPRLAVSSLVTDQEAT